MQKRQINRKFTVTDQGGERFEIGYADLSRVSKALPCPVFWIDSKNDSVTLELTPVQLRALATRLLQKADLVEQARACAASSSR